METRDKWSSHRLLLEYDEDSHTETVAGANGKKRAVVQDVLPAIFDEPFAKLVRESNDVLDGIMDEFTNTPENEYATSLPPITDRSHITTAVLVNFRTQYFDDAVFVVPTPRDKVEIF